MSLSRFNSLTRMRLGQPCPRCGAEPREPCSTPKGGYAGEIHKDRGHHLWVAWLSGFHEGKMDLKKEKKK